MQRYSEFTNTSNPKKVIQHASHIMMVVMWVFRRIHLIPTMIWIVNERCILGGLPMAAAYVCVG